NPGVRKAEMVTVGRDEEGVVGGAAGQGVAHVVVDALDLENVAAAAAVDGQVVDAGVRDRRGRGVGGSLQLLAQCRDDALFAGDVLVHNLPGERRRVVCVSGAQRVGRWGQGPNPNCGIAIEDGEGVYAFVARGGNDADGVAIAAVGEIQADAIVGRT